MRAALSFHLVPRCKLWTMKTDTSLRFNSHAIAVASVFSLLVGCTSKTSIPSPGMSQTKSAFERELARRILADKDLDDVLGRARQLLKDGFNAGTGYPEVWIRDFATFMDVSCQVNDPAAIRSALLTLARF